MAANSEEFALQCTKQAIARAGVAVGFKDAQAGVLDVLSDVMRNYIEKVSSSSLKIAESHGRVQPGIQDVIQTLENMRPSATMTDLRAFAMPDQLGLSATSANIFADDDDEDENTNKGPGNKAWHQPFPHSVPDFPVRQKVKKDAPLPDETEMRGKCVPSHLPCYPPPHTYRRSHGHGKKRAAEGGKDGQEQGGGASQRARSTVSKSLGKIENAADDER